MAERHSVAVRVTRLEAVVPEGVPVRWQGNLIPSGPLAVTLDPEHESEGQLDYGSGRASVEFHVQLSFSELARALDGLGVDRAMTEPVRAVIRSKGKILPDHSFMLSGACELRPHALFDPQATHAAVLPGL